MKVTHTIAFILVIIVGLNWGLVGLAKLFASATANWNVVNLLLGSISWLEGLVYLLVGLSALVLVFTHKSSCKMCVKGGQSM